MLSVARAKLHCGVDVTSIGFAWLVSCIVGLFTRTTVQMLIAMRERNLHSHDSSVLH